MFGDVAGFLGYNSPYRMINDLVCRLLGAPRFFFLATYRVRRL